MAPHSDSRMVTRSSRSMRSSTRSSSPSKNITSDITSSNIINSSPIRSKTPSSPIINHDSDHALNDDVNTNTNTNIDIKNIPSLNNNDIKSEVLKTNSSDNSDEELKNITIKRKKSLRIESDEDEDDDEDIDYGINDTNDKDPDHREEEEEGDDEQDDDDDYYDYDDDDGDGYDRNRNNLRKRSGKSVLDNNQHTLSKRHNTSNKKRKLSIDNSTKDIKKEEIEEIEETFNNEEQQEQEKDDDDDDEEEDEENNDDYEIGKSVDSTISLKELTNLKFNSINEIEEFKLSLEKDYKKLSNDFINSRLKRTSNLINLIEFLINDLKLNFNKFKLKLNSYTDQDEIIKENNNDDDDNNDNLKFFLNI
ncbi:unnamed protein product [[Candida] boidinii]|uniref:Unnamed protein product n=1 Tax=Candida boidinii TaxID=5477 RepID=A0ACB5U3Z3_CANBO|nr:unnamed protein product [[Candida] boidinii]